MSASAINFRDKLALFAEPWSPRVIAEMNDVQVPRGAQHRPVAMDECSVMLVEPRGVVNIGEAGGAYTAPNDVWI